MRTGSPTLVSLALKTGVDFQKNLDHLKALCRETPSGSIIAAPEVSVTGFCYERFEEAAAFAATIDNALKQCSLSDRTIILTLIEKEQGHFYNVAKVYHNGAVIHLQRKNRLFPLGEEDLHFTPGREEEILLFEIGRVKIGILICFELRFTELWQQLKGADLICVPAQWGKSRADHFLTLTKALAIANQCYVLASDATNPEASAGSGVIAPSGEAFRNQEREMISLPFDLHLLKKMRRYINVGLPIG